MNYANCVVCKIMDLELLLMGQYGTWAYQIRTTLLLGSV